MWTVSKIRNEIIPGIMTVVADANCNYLKEYDKCVAIGSNKEVFTLFDKFIENNEFLPSDEVMSYTAKFCKFVIKNGSKDFSEQMQKTLEKGFLAQYA